MIGFDCGGFDWNGFLLNGFAGIPVWGLCVLVECV